MVGAERVEAVFIVPLAVQFEENKVHDVCKTKRATELSSGDPPKKPNENNLPYVVVPALPWQGLRLNDGQQNGHPTLGNICKIHNSLTKTRLKVPVT